MKKHWQALFFAAGVFLGAGTCHAEAASPSAPAIPYKRDNGASDGEWSRVAIGLTVFALAAAGAVYIVRRRLGQQGKAGAPKRLRLLESQRLNPRASLHVVEFAGSYYLLAHSEQGINCVASSPKS
ncbi:MAG TPA: flagellar biosynthetic protein FliO, partial [Noviherbaspirillum sp.]